jgi:hypothetical protein
MIFTSETFKTITNNEFRFLSYQVEDRLTYPYHFEKIGVYDSVLKKPFYFDLYVANNRLYIELISPFLQVEKKRIHTLLLRLKTIAENVLSIHPSYRIKFATKMFVVSCDKEFMDEEQLSLTFFENLKQQYFEYFDWFSVFLIVSLMLPSFISLYLGIHFFPSDASWWRKALIYGYVSLMQIPLLILVVRIGYWLFALFLECRGIFILSKRKKKF